MEEGGTPSDHYDDPFTLSLLSLRFTLSRGVLLRISEYYLVLVNSSSYCLLAKGRNSR